jgi:hypothetical protein
MNAMKTWFALLAVPALVLATQSADYALVYYACAWHTRAPLHAVSGVALVISIAATALAYRRWRHTSAPYPASYDPREARQACLACAAMVVGAFGTLVQVMMWFPQWLLSACR